MARSNDVQYIRFYSYGSAAEKVELTPREKKKVTLPRPRLDRVGEKIQKMDPLALLGMTVAVAMLLCMLLGVAKVNRVNAELQDAKLLVSKLEAENDRRRTEYAHELDLAEIRVSAEAMGLGPVEEGRHVKLRLPEPVAVEEITWWEQWILDFKALFA